MRYSYVRDTSIVPPLDVEAYVGDLSGLGVYFFGSLGRIHGILAGIRGRAYVIAATQRGFIYRFGARIYSPYPGYWESIFGLRTGFKGIDTMLKIRMRDEIIPVTFRPNWIHGALHFSDTGIISFVITTIDHSVFPRVERENLEEFSTALLNGDNFYDKDGEERKQLDSY